MAIIMPFGVVGGKLQPSLVYVGQSTAGAAIGAPATITISGLSFGDAVSGINQKWALLSLLAWGDSTVVFSSITIGGVAATVIHQVNQAPTAGLGADATFALAVAQIDSVTSGSAQWTDDTATAVWASVAYGVNIDMSAISDSAKGTGANNATLSIDVPAGGAAFGHSYFFYTAGAPTQGGNTNLTTHHLTDFPPNTNIGHSAAGAVFSAAQTGLNVSTAYSPNGARPGGYAVSFAGI